MNTKQKVALDRVVGTPIAWATNLLARALGKLLRRDHSTAPESVRSIVVLKMLGMGSIMEATPLLAALRDGFPRAEIVFVTSVRNRELIERLPLVDRGLYVADESPWGVAQSTGSLIARLIRRRIDLFLDLEVYSAAASALSALSCARNRFGFYNHSARFKRHAYTHLVKFATNRPIARLYLQLGLAAGASEVPLNRLGPIRVDAEDHHRLATTLGAYGMQLPEEYVLVNPNASDLMAERRWPLDHFALLLESLAAEGRQMVVVGASGERAYVQRLLARLSPAARGQVVDTSGRLTLGELLAAIAGARCVVTNDTGPMHFAFALGRPAVCLFGPVDPLHYGFAAANVEMLYVPVFCSPCAHDTEPPPCGGNNVCMQLIEPTEVLHAVHRLLGLPAPPRPPQPRLRSADLEGRALGIIARVSLPSISTPGGQEPRKGARER